MIHFIQSLPKVENYEDLGLKSFLVFIILVLITAGVYLFKDNKSKTKEHIDDLKAFDNERAKTVIEQMQMINKVILSLEQIQKAQETNSVEGKEISKSLDKLLMMIENIKSKVHE